MARDSLLSPFYFLSCIRTLPDLWRLHWHQRCWSCSLIKPAFSKVKAACIFQCLHSQFGLFELIFSSSLSAFTSTLLWPQISHPNLFMQLMSFIPHLKASKTKVLAKEKKKKEEERLEKCKRSPYSIFYIIYTLQFTGLEAS